VVSFSKYRQCIITAPGVRTRTYAFGALTTCVLTNQGEACQYIDHVVNLNRIDSHHHPNEHTILYVFRAPGYDSIVPLSWYKQIALEEI